VSRRAVDSQCGQSCASQAAFGTSRRADPRLSREPAESHRNTVELERPNGGSPATKSPGGTLAARPGQSYRAGLGFQLVRMGRATAEAQENPRGYWQASRIAAAQVIAVLFDGELTEARRSLCRSLNRKPASCLPAPAESAE